METEGNNKHLMTGPKGNTECTLRWKKRTRLTPTVAVPAVRAAVKPRCPTETTRTTVVFFAANKR